jgi:hypothetical protein
MRSIMSNALLSALAGIDASRARGTEATPPTRTPAPAFDACLATFYPYAQSPVDPQPRAGAPEAADARSGGVNALRAASQRRRFGRGDG